MLNTSVAQSIVDRTMSVLNVNVNIMDVNGTVIASGDQARIGTFHCAAAEVIATGRKKSVTAEEAAQMDSVEHGVTQPIVYKGSIIGALGMTGEPSYVEKYVELAVLSAQLIIEQEEMKQRGFQEQRVRESVLLDLFTGRCLEDPEVFRQRLSFLNHRWDRPQRLLAVRLEALEDQTDLIRCQQLKDRLTDLIGRYRICGSGMVGCFLHQRLALLLPTREEERSGGPWEGELEGFAQLLQQETGGRVLLVRDALCRDWQEIPAAYRRAKGTLDIAWHWSDTGPVIASEDYRSEYALFQLPAQTRSDFWHSVLGRLLSGKPEQRNLSLHTLQVYYQNDMNVQKTADELFIHRNTLNMRLNKIREYTGYAPQKFQDAFVLRMAMLLRELEEPKTEKERSL